MVSKTLSAKISPPNIGKTFKRDRLYKLLDKNREKPALWISGPAGSGKTMLTASYLNQRGLSSLWYQVDMRDADPATIFYYLRQAVQQLSISDPPTLPLLTSEYLGGIAAFSHNFFETLFQHLNPPFILVFDNYQEVGEETIFHQVMRDMLSVVPHGFQVVLISRTRPPVEMSRLELHRDISILNWQDLQLTLEEVKGIARMFLKRPLSDQEANAIHSKTLGWAAGVILLLGQPAQGFKSSETDIVSTTQSVFDYFSGKILDGLDDKMRTFLIKSSVLPQITAAMASDLTGNKNAGRILADLARKSYFTMQRNDNRSQMYQFHPLFKDFLQDHAQTILPQEDLRQLKLRAASMLMENNQYEEAAGLLINLKDWKRLMGLIIDQAHSMVMQGRSESLQQWIDNIPEEFRMKDPWMLYWQGICNLTIDLMTSRSSFEIAYRLFKNQDEPTGFYLAWSGIVETYVYEWGDFTPLDQWINEMDALLVSHPEFPSAQIEAQVTSAIFCALIYRCPDHPDMELWEERVKEVIFNTCDMHLKFGLGSHLVLYYSWWIGGQTKAKFISDTLKHALSEGNVAPIYQIIWHSLTGINLWMTNHYKESHHELTVGLSIAKKNGIHFWDFMLLSSLTHCSLCQGDMKTAKKYLKQMSFILNTNRKLDITHYYYMKAYAELNSGNLDRALDQINEAVEHGKHAGSPFGYHWITTGKADILIDRGEYEQAQEIIDHIYLFGQKMKSRNIEYQCEWLRARIDFKQNNKESGIAHLRKFLSISRLHETVNHTGWRSSVMAPLLQKALEAEMDIDHVKRLIKEHDILPPDSGGHADHWPYPLRIRTLGSFSILIDDKPLSYKDQGQAKPLMLLKALVAFGGDDVSESQLSEVLWPDADTGAARVAFNTTLHRLRKLIGYEHAVILQDHRISLDPKYCWIDVWYLKRLLGQFNTLECTQKENLTNLSQFSQEIFKLYQGPFLEGDHDHWVIGLREHLQNQVIRQVKHIAVLNEKHKHWKRAKTIYEQGLKIDNLVEEFYQGQMRCCLAMDQHAEGLKAYRRCHKILFNILGIEPSSDTQELKRQLQGSGSDR